MITPPDLSVVRRSGRGALAKCGRLNVLLLEGEPYDIGLQHGTLLKAEIAAGCAPVFGGVQGFDELFAGHPAPEAAMAGRLIDGLYAELEAGLDAALKAELAGIGEGAGVPVHVLMRATFRSEILQVLSAMDAATRAERLPGECTALIALARRTLGGRLLHGKNQDYDGAGLWDAVPTVAVVRTSDALPHVRVGTAGLLKASFGMNAAGLTVGGHLLFSKHAAPAGMGFTAFEHALLKRADSLAAAQQILTDQQRWGAFAFTLSDGGADDARVFECDGQGVFTRSPEADLLACANHFVAPDKPGERDLLLAGGGGRNSIARLTRARAAAGEESLTPALLAEVLADRFDPCCGALRSLGQTIAGPLTVMSAIAEPAMRRLWVSQAQTPTCDGPYIGFDLAEAFEGGEIRLTEPLAEGGFAGGARRAALRASLAARRSLEDNDVAQALSELDEAIELDPTDSAHRRILARLLIRQERFDTALDALDMGGAVQSANELAETAYLAAIALDGLGRRLEAVSQLTMILEAPVEAAELTRLNPKLIALARRHLTKAFDARDIGRLPMAFTLHSGVE